MPKWLKRNWGFALVIATALAIATLVAVWTWPEPPTLPTYGEERPRSSHYRPGNESCEPARLAAIRGSEKRAKQTESCHKEAEQYRLDTNDLVQQARSADAAKALTNISSQELWTAWLQTIGGFLTLVAAIVAAFYARRAAITATHHDLRAYVTPGGVSIRKFQRGGDLLWSISAGWANTGRTPALGVLSNLNWQDFPGEPPSDYDFPDQPEQCEHSPALLGSGATFSDRSREASDELIRSVRHGERRLFVWGWVEYYDIFSSERRRTEFCHEVWIIMMDGKQAEEFYPFGKHNGLDDTCGKQPKS